MFRRFTGLFQRKPQIAEQPVEQMSEIKSKRIQKIEILRELMNKNIKHQLDYNSKLSKEFGILSNTQKQIDNLDVKLKPVITYIKKKLDEARFFVKVMDDDKIISLREMIENKENNGKSKYFNTLVRFLHGHIEDEKNFENNIKSSEQPFLWFECKENLNDKNVCDYYYFYKLGEDEYNEYKIPKGFYYKNKLFYDVYIDDSTFIHDFLLDTNFFYPHEFLHPEEMEGEESPTRPNLNEINGIEEPKHEESPEELKTGGKRHRQRKTRKQRRRRHQKSRKSRRY